MKKTNMQLTHPRGKFVENIVRDSSGRLARVCFCVYEENGKIKARLLNVSYIVQTVHGCEKILKLSAPAERAKVNQNIYFGSKIISSYYNFFSLYISGSKPRAPTK